VSVINRVQGGGGGGLVHARAPERSGDLVVKHASASFADASQLAVGPGECAVFARGRECVGIVGPGRHILSAAQLSFLQAIRDPGTGAYAAALFFVTTTPVSNVRVGGPLGRLADAGGQSANLMVFGSLTLRAADPARLVTAAGEVTGDALMPLVGPRFLALATSCAHEWLSGGHFTIASLDQMGQPMARTLAPHCGFLGELGLELVSIDALNVAGR
jgi:hypothetical protein